MASITKAELTEQANAAYDYFVANATRNDLFTFLAWLKSDRSEKSDPGALTTLVFHDAAGHNTTFDLTEGTITEGSINRIWQDGLDISGSGNTLTIDVNNFKFPNGVNLEFDPPPDARPVTLTWSSPEKDEEEGGQPQPEQEGDEGEEPPPAPAEEEPAEEEEAEEEEAP